MARYRRIAICLWGDGKFKALSKPAPNGQTLWIYLLTGEHTLAIPGLSRIGEQALAEALGWPIDEFRRCFQEIAAKGMAEADWSNRVLWLPNAVAYNPPESVNVVKAWVKSTEEIPECPLKNKALAGVFAYLKGMKEGKSKAFALAFREALPKAIALQEQYQEQEQKQEQEVVEGYPAGPDNFADDRAVFEAIVGVWNGCGGKQNLCDTRSRRAAAWKAFRRAVEELCRPTQFTPSGYKPHVVAEELYKAVLMYATIWREQPRPERDWALCSFLATNDTGPIWRYMEAKPMCHQNFTFAATAPDRPRPEKLEVPA